MAIFCCPLCTVGGRDRANMRQHVSQQHPNWQNVLEFAKPLPQMNSIKRKAEVQSDSTKKIKFPRQVEEIPEDDILLPGNSGSSSSRWKNLSYLSLIIYIFLFSLTYGEPIIPTYNSQPRNTKVVTMPDLQRGDDISEDDSDSEDESAGPKRSVSPSHNM